jgi:very-short-patch-repair endonuclease
MGNPGGTSRDGESVYGVVGRLAASQHGVFARAQAMSLGVSSRQIQRRVARGRWDSPFPRVCRIVGSGDDRQTAMAATLWAGDGAFVSHGAAAMLWGIDGVRATTIEVSVPDDRHPRARGVLVHRSGSLVESDGTRLGSVPITTSVRTLIDVAGRLEDDRLLAAMESLFRRQLATPSLLATRLDVLRGSGRPGTGRLAVLRDGRGDCVPMESVLEAKVWRLLVGSALPRPARQHWVATGAGRYRLDFAWPDRMLGLECDGWEHHQGRAAFGKDRERLSELGAHGWRVLVVTWDMVVRRPDRVAGWVEMALAA